MPFTFEQYSGMAHFFHKSFPVPIIALKCVSYIKILSA